MLGMMNCPSDSVEFYATNPGKSGQPPISGEDKKAFTEPKEKTKTSYTQDGRMMIDGKVVDEKEASTLWGGVLLRSAVKKMPIPVDGSIEKEEHEEDDEKTIEVVEEVELCTSPILKEPIDMNESSINESSIDQ